LLGFAFLCILASPGPLAARLHGAFQAIGFVDPRAYVVRNGLDSAFEVLTRMPVIALFAASGGATAHALVERTPRPVQRALAWTAPLVLVAGGWALYYHANGLERSARPPYVMTGELLTAAAFCAAHPIWSALRITSPLTEADREGICR
jgi:hypothetical protein